MVQIVPTLQLGQTLGSGKCGINMDKESIRNNKQTTSPLSLLLTLPQHQSTTTIIQRINHLSPTLSFKHLIHIFFLSFLLHFITYN